MGLFGTKRRFYTVNASELSSDGSIDHLHLRCRRFDLNLAAEMEELLARLQGAYTPADPEALEPQDEDDGDLDSFGSLQALHSDIDDYCIKLIVAYNDQPPEEAFQAWTDVQFVATEEEEDEAEGKAWIGRLALGARQAVVTQGLAAVIAATQRVQRFQSQAAADAGDAGAGRGDASQPAAVAG